MALTGTVAEVTPIGTNVEVLVKLPNGTAGRYVLSLLNPQLQQTLEALARQAVTPVNDALIKANLTLLVPGLQLDLSDPAVEPPPPPTEDDRAVQAFADAITAFLIDRSKAGLSDPLTALYAKGTEAQRVRFDQVLSIVRP